MIRDPQHSRPWPGRLAPSPKSVISRKFRVVGPVEPVQGPGGGLVPQPLEHRGEEGASAVALVDEGQPRIQGQAVLLDAALEGVELAGDRVVLGLLLGGDAGVDRRPQRGVVHRVRLRLLVVWGEVFDRSAVLRGPIPRRPSWDEGQSLISGG